ncbi:carbohydrate porin [Archangium sp.]|uniref:carbohydrate porin n=1 Tax=Archangium sp. TaxID=1872627 RepID=UPI002ED78696
MCLTATPQHARAEVPISDRLSFEMYGRMGTAYALDGRVIQGTRLNLRGGPIGGRFEEGDYLEPTLKFYILKPGTEESTGVRLVLTPAMFARTSFLGFFTSNTFPNLGIEIFQAYAEATNVLIPGLSFWGGQRFYRGEDVHIADYYYFNQLNGQGGGVRYKELDFALLLQTGPRNSPPFYGYDETGDETPDAQRQRLVFVSQYVHRFPVEEKRAHRLHLLAEAHVLPSAKTRDGAEVLPADLGWVLGVKGTLELGKGTFNTLAVRYGWGIANGTIGGSSTWATFGLPDEDGRFRGAYALEVVDHFVYNVSPLLSINGYGILQLAHGASDAATDKGFDYAVGARTFLYLLDQFHLINEVTYQTRRDGDGPTGSVVKLSIVPTLVPSGERSVWTRPHFRLFYTLGIYNRAARDALMSPYLQAFGPDRIAHYVGARVEWWF